MPFGGSRSDLPLPDDSAAVYCGACGEALDAGDHDRCRQRLALEPPRFCGQCRRRMKVQVIPGAWTATCVEHGSVEHPTWS